MILALMSLNPFELDRKRSLGDADAAIVYPIRRKGNQLLVSLVFATTVINAALTVYLNSITSGLAAVIIATLLIMVFGTLLPEALFSRIALWIGARSAPFIRLILLVSWPVCVPIAKVLDAWLGKELPTVYSKEELIKILEEHKRSPDSAVEADEERIARGALSFGDRTVSEVMVPRSMMTAVEKNTLLTPKEIAKLKASAYSRFPVYDGSIDTVVGTLYAHELVGAAHGKKAGEVADPTVKYVRETDLLDRLLNGFLKTRHHLFIVTNNFSETVGVVALEDVLEAILGKKIVDEFDVYDDARAVALRRR